jgi:membrane fusion protein (multidrug efflux system)
MTPCTRPLAVAGSAVAPLLLVAALGLACGAKPAAPAAGPVEVGVITVRPTPVTLTRDLPGRTSAFRVAEVRARVNGIVTRRLFVEGSDVKEGQRLFLLDPAPFQATVDGAQAAQARAEATLANARLLAERAAELLKDNAVSRQENDAAVAALKTAEADVAAARAAEQLARINLGYTAVTSPVSGRIGRSAVTEGAFVQASQATLLATVQQLDQVYVDIPQSTTELLALRRDLESGRLQAAGQGQARVRLLTEDGHEYGQAGALQFADVSVDPGTGSVVLRALFPNPKAELLPGMFVRARLEEGISPEALLVPQVGVTRDQKGMPVALVVTPDRKVERRQLTTDRAVGDAWLVTSGLKAGEQVIVEGLQKVRPGAQVNPVPASGVKQP